MTPLAAVQPAEQEALFHVPVPEITERVLKVSTKNIELPDDVAYNDGDEFDVTLRCRIEKIGVEAPRNKHGKPKHTRFVSYATVLEYRGDDFAVTTGSDDDGDDEE